MAPIRERERERERSGTKKGVEELPVDGVDGGEGMKSWMCGDGETW